MMVGDLASPSEIVDSTGDAAFATDERHRIVAWNEAAEDLLGFRSSQVVGRSCHEILCGKDLFGNTYCDEACTMSRMVLRREPVRSFELDVRHASGKLLRTMFSILALPAVSSKRFAIIHTLSLVHGGSRGPAREEHSTEVSDPSTSTILPLRETSPSLPKLTGREIEILRLLAEGHSSKDIAHELIIGLATVRTHSQNILRKLEVHSQLEAVALAFRHGLI